MRRVESLRPFSGTGAVAHIDRHRGANACRVGAGQIEKLDIALEDEDREPRSVSRPIDAASILENLGKTGIGHRRAVEDRAFLDERLATRILEMVIKTRIRGAVVTKFVPSGRVVAGFTVDSGVAWALFLCVDRGLYPADDLELGWVGKLRHLSVPRDRARFQPAVLGTGLARATPSD